MLTVEQIPKNLTYLRSAVEDWIKDQSDLKKPEKFKSTLNGFAESYRVNLMKMSHKDMILLDHRIAYTLG